MMRAGGRVRGTNVEASRRKETKKRESDGSRKSGGSAADDRGGEGGKKRRVTETVIWRPKVRMGMSYVIRSTRIGRPRRLNNRVYHLR